MICRCTEYCLCGPDYVCGERCVCRTGKSSNLCAKCGKDCICKLATETDRGEAAVPGIGVSSNKDPASDDQDQPVASASSARLGNIVVLVQDGVSVPGNEKFARAPSIKESNSNKIKDSSSKYGFYPIKKVVRNISFGTSSSGERKVETFSGNMDPPGTTKTCPGKSFTSVKCACGSKPCCKGKCPAASGSSKDVKPALSSTKRRSTSQYNEKSDKDISKLAEIPKATSEKDLVPEDPFFGSAKVMKISTGDLAPPTTLETVEPTEQKNQQLANLVSGEPELMTTPRIDDDPNDNMSSGRWKVEILSGDMSLPDTVQTCPCKSCTCTNGECGLKPCSKGKCPAASGSSKDVKLALSSTKRRSTEEQYNEKSDIGTSKLAEIPKATSEKDHSEDPFFGKAKVMKISVGDLAPPVPFETVEATKPKTQPLANLVSEEPELTTTPGIETPGSEGPAVSSEEKGKEQSTDKGVSSPDKPDDVGK